MTRFKDLWEDFQEIRKSKGLLAAFKSLMVGKALDSLATPVGFEINPMSKVHKRLPRLKSVIVDWEEWHNTTVGVCAATGESIYPKKVFFKNQGFHYLQLTPAVRGKRAEQIVEVLKGGALNPPQQEGTLIDMGEEEPLAPLPTDKKRDQY